MQTGEQFLGWFCNLLEGHRSLKLSEIDDVELSEQVENDPAVKAAAQAYAEAVAKASAEARKKNM